MKRTFAIAYLFLGSLMFAQSNHTVVKGDTAYNISKKYGMSLDDLYKLNPEIKEGLALGAVIKVKGGKENTNAPVKVSTLETKLGKIVLKPKQTHYSLTKQYHISFEELKKLNPDLDQLTKIGDEIVLPLASIQKYGDKEENPVSEKTTVATVVETPKTLEGSTTSDNRNTYQVKEKDNYYRITKEFGITKAQLFALNPELQEKGLQPGAILIVKGDLPATELENPVSTKTDTTPVKTEVTPVNTAIGNQDDYVTYTVQSGDTVFGILNKFGITLDQLMALNPELSNGLKTGMVLKIKKKDKIFVKKTGDRLNVVLMLPFGFDTNDSKYRNISSDFLIGAKLAIERNVKGGLPMDVTVVDAGNEKTFKNTLTQLDRDNTDLIIGPFFKSSVLEVLDFVKDQKIPVVAPFANAEDMYDYSNLIIVGTSDEVYADKIAKEVKEVFSDQKIYIVADPNGSNAGYLKSILTKQLKNPNIVIVSKASEIKLDQNMMTGQAAPIIAILAQDDEDKGNEFAAKMIELSKETSGIKAFGMYYEPVFDKKADELSKVSLVYLMDRKINTEGNFEKQILADFKAKYCKVPTKYNIIGFDVVNDILSRENKKGEVLKNMDKAQTQLATKFDFERIKKGGAFVNKGYRVIRLIP